VADEVTRSAARWATIGAVPVALLAAAAIFLTARGGPSPSPSESPRVQSSAPVPMPARKLSARQETVCRALLSQLPHAIRDLSQRPVTAGTEQNAAYGDPPITLACGTTVPSFAPTDKVYPLDAVCWYPVRRPDATVWTTVDREVPVTVTVPTVYDQPGQWVIEFSTPVAAAVRSAEKVPYGCRPPG
jgi:hypothetical protein